MCALTDHCSESAPSAAPAAASVGRDAQMDWRRIAEVVKHVHDSQSRHSAKTEAPSTTRTRSAPVEPKDLHILKTDKSEKTVGE